MSSADKEKRKADDEAKARIAEEKSLVEPVPKNPEFTAWLEQMFGEQQFPQSIDVTPLSGKHLERMGGPIMKRIFESGKPERSKIVEFANEILFRVQRDCDVQRKRMVYGVNVRHFAIDPQPYEQWTIECNSTTKHRGDGVPRDASDEDESMETRHSVQILHHHEKMFGLYAEGYTGMLDRYDRDKERDRDEIERLRRENAQLREENERAKSLDAERKERLEWVRLGVKGAGEALNLGLSLAPHFMNKLLGEPVLPGGETPESVTLKRFFKPKEEGGVLTAEQIDAAFGVYTVPTDGKAPELIKPGVLSWPQAQLLYAIAHGKAPLDRLDDFLPGGPLEIATEQVVGLQSKAGFTMDIIAPLHLIFESRSREKERRQQQQGQQAAAG